MYVELITILVRAKDDITRACRRCQSTLYIVFNIAKVGGPHQTRTTQIPGCSLVSTGVWPTVVGITMGVIHLKPQRITLKWKETCKDMCVLAMKEILYGRVIRAG